jgi:nucleoid DNA-binding protein
MTKKQLEEDVLFCLNVVKDAPIIDTVLNAIRIGLEETGGPIILKGFGTFRIKLRAEKKCRNPNTGETIIVPAHNVVTFKPSKNFFIEAPE